MSLRFSKKELLILIATILFLMACLFAGFYLYLNPKKADITNKQAQLATEEQLLAAIETKTAGTSAPSAESIAELQKKVPVKQQLEQLILDLNKAEVISGSFISTMSFSEGDVAAAVVEGESTEAAEGTEQATDETNQVNQSVEGTAESADAEEQVQPIPLPEGIKKLNANLSLTSPGYTELKKFLVTLESLNRFVVIESVAFSGGSELTSIDTESDELSYSVTLSAFYMPELEDLQDQLPELEVPTPSGKTNPFATSADLPDETASE